MPINPVFLVRDANGRPQPPSDLVARIKAREPRIGLFYSNVGWAITEAWKDDDPRRIRIQQGEMQPEFAFDIAGYLPVSCSVDEAPGYIERELRGYSAEQFSALRETVKRWNEGVQDSAVQSQVLGAVSNDLDAGNIVSPGISAAVAMNVSESAATESITARASAKRRAG